MIRHGSSRGLSRFGTKILGISGRQRRHLSRALGQQFFVETRAAGAGVIGIQFVTHAEPDGYNLVVTTLSLLALALSSIRRSARPSQ
jgi:tripartite-type tricarboxylate transporter receptor subunit TctC